ncbi:MAG: peptide-methionine (S)-S-oxide reductase MsrA [Rhizobacter sp.]|nr:peptide-methionine (S)-S-oxide reductase MsrA [Chlorobiales bacterium]
MTVSSSTLTPDKTNASSLETATFATGCFWCTEAVFQRIEGVVAVESGYISGKVKNPTYEQVCTGSTGHAEAIQIKFDPAKISYDELLTVFWHTHDPTTLNRQGNDTGTQYRSGIFYHTAAQKDAAEKSKQKITAENVWSNPIVTEITAASTWYPAEAYHQDYFNQHPNQGYCAAVINPKLQKFRKQFKEKLKAE